jgi:hypothetical protein
MEPHHEAVWDLVRWSHPGGIKDDYWKDAIPPLPLSFERVNEGRAPQSNALLFQSPFEILGAITQCLHPSSLPSLALVNRDCCQLARSRRFARVKLDYGHDSLFLLNVLLREASERNEDNGLTRHPSLGACIRRIQVVVDPLTMSRHHDLNFTALGEIDDDVTAQRVKEAYDGYFGSYLAAIESVLPIALPHLELLNWRDRISMPASIFNALACSSIQHLKLCKITTDEAFEIQLPGILARRDWPLRSLHLELHWRIGGPGCEKTSLLCASILRLCAATLESLTWTIMRRNFNDQDIQCFDIQGLELLRFPSLRDLKLGNMLVSSSALEGLLCSGPQSRLQVLEVNTEADDVRSRFFDSCGTIPSLETFVWSTSTRLADYSISFLSSNPQLSKLSICREQPPSFLEEKILPLLTGSFRKLMSLQLKWGDYSIPESALEQIATLQSLQQLSLSAGDPFEGGSYWLIHHRTMRRHLGKLQNLRKIAFGRDCYNMSEIPEQYLEYIIPISSADEEEVAEGTEDPDEEDSDHVDSDGRGQSRWESLHRKRMLLEADRYCRLLPELQWLYLGQLPMGVVESNDPKEGRKAVALLPARAKCGLLLRRMFGRENAAPESWDL